MEIEITAEEIYEQSAIYKYNDIMNSMKELFSNILQTVMEAELERKLGYEKSELASDKVEKLQKWLPEEDGKNIAWRGRCQNSRECNGEYELHIIEKYNRNADGV